MGTDDFAEEVSVTRLDGETKSITCDEPSPSSEPRFWTQVAGDLRAQRGRSSGPVAFVASMLLNRGFIAVFLYRLGRISRSTRVIPALCRRLGVLISGASIHPSAEIGPGLVLPHPSGVVVGRDVVIGRDVFLFQGVVLGPRNHETGAGAPTVEDFVRLFPHACVFGAVTIGRETEISANSVVVKSVPAKSVVMPPKSIVFRGMPFGMRGFSPGPSEESARLEGAPS